MVCSLVQVPVPPLNVLPGWLQEMICLGALPPLARSLWVTLIDSLEFHSCSRFPVHFRDALRFQLSLLVPPPFILPIPDSSSFPFLLPGPSPYLWQCISTHNDIHTFLFKLSLLLSFSVSVSCSMFFLYFIANIHLWVSTPCLSFWGWVTSVRMIYFF